uniref:Uncharacterized protein n=1 Tax=Kalanchoe fedtschenkoi TaxID=63787 RepID=A0A7N0RAQ1_KALFE
MFLDLVGKLEFIPYFCQPNSRGTLYLLLPVSSSILSQPISCIPRSRLTMKHADIENPDDEQDQSFSFNNNNRNQQFIMSDSDQDDDDDDDDGSYIEIALDQKPSRHQPDHLLQFRLSFSTLLPRNFSSEGSFRCKFLMPAESAESDSYTCLVDSSSMSSCSSSSSAFLGRSNARRNACGNLFETSALAKSSEIGLVEKENKWRKAVQLVAVQRLMKLLILNLSSSPAPAGHCDCKTTRELADEKCQNMDKRKQSKVIKTLSRGLMKLIIKFRTIKAKSKMPLTRASKQIPGPEQVTYDLEPDKLSYESPVDPFLRRERKRTKPSRLPEVTINSIKGAIDSLTVGSPASIKSSPIHRNSCASEIKPYARENSIQAAIAHCKMSLEHSF